MNGGSLGVNGNNDATTVVRGETVPANSEVDKECLVLTKKKQIKYYKDFLKSSFETSTRKHIQNHYQILF